MRVKTLQRIALGGALLVLGAGQAIASLDADPAEERFLETLFALTDEAALQNARVVRWFLREGQEALYPADYLARADGVRARVEALAPPSRLANVHFYVVQCLRLQRAFVQEWYGALENGRPFASQLTDEYAYHEGLHRSRRLLLKAYAELRAFYPRADDETLHSFQAHLRTLELR